MVGKSLVMPKAISPSRERIDPMETAGRAQYSQRAGTLARAAAREWLREPGRRAQPRPLPAPWGESLLGRMTWDHLGTP